METGIVAMASEVLGITAEKVTTNCRVVPEIDGYYIWNPARGGRSMLVSKSGERLVATSAVAFSTHLCDFVAGKRN